MAGVNACTKGCMSVLDRSYFSYQVAAGSTMSESKVVDVIRKSADSSRSSFPPEPRPPGRRRAVARRRRSSSAMTLEWVPSRYLRKYSLPLAEEPNRLERHSVSVRGQFSGASTSSIDALMRAGVPERSRRMKRRLGALPAATAASACVGEIQRVDVELRIERHPPQPRRLSDGVGCVHAGQVSFSQRRGERVGGSTRRSATGRYACTSTRCRSWSAAVATSRARWPARSSR